MAIRAYLLTHGLTEEVTDQLRLRDWLDLLESAYVHVRHEGIPEGITQLREGIAQALEAERRRLSNAGLAPSWGVDERGMPTWGTSASGQAGIAQATAMIGAADPTAATGER